MKQTNTKKGYKKTKLGLIPEDWKVVKYTDISEIKVGRDLKENNFSNEFSDEFKYPIYSNTVSNYGLYGFYDFVEYDFECITIVGRGIGLGTAFYRNGKFGAIGRLLVVIPNEFVDSKFLSEYTNFKVRFHTESSGIPQLTGVQLSNYQLAVPPLQQQKKIAKILSTWDVAINKQTQLIQAKQKQKKALMQLLLTGKKRFDGFTEEWKEVKLGDIAIKKSSNLSANSLSNNNGDFKVYGATGFLKRIDFYREKEKYISIVKDGAGVGRTLLCDAKSSVLGTLDVIKPKDNVDLYFLYLVLKMINFLKYIIGSTIPHIYFKNYSTCKIKIPTLKEQQKIAQVLSKADQEISLLKEQLVQLQQQKQGLMQVLLTGKVLVTV